MDPSDSISQDKIDAAFGVAQKTLVQLIARLPEELRPEALRAGYRLAARNAFPGEEDFLGSYMDETQDIVLYVVTLLEYCIEEELDFEREVEITYLHEFGHHLGLGENELLDRGL
jgi:predicted Zn-dependent protease with MMP-like domain